MSTRKWIAVILLVLGLLYWIWPASETGQETLVNRVWLSAQPAHPRDKVWIALFLEPDRMGVLEHASSFQGQFDLFRFAVEQDAVQLEMLQDQQRVRAAFDARPCQEPGFDFCLRLDGSPAGPSRYYSRKGWEVETRQEAEGLVARLFSP